MLLKLTIHFFARDDLISFVVDPWLEHGIINITTTRNCKVIGNFTCHTTTWKFQHRTTCAILQFFFSQHNYTRVIKSTRSSNWVSNRLEDSWFMLIKKIFQQIFFAFFPSQSSFSQSSLKSHWHYKSWWEFLYNL